MNEPVVDHDPDHSIRTALLMPGARRVEAYSRHPVMRGKQLLPTTPLAIAYQRFKDVLKSPEFGIAFYCDPRNGKTRALDAFAKYLALEFPHIPVLRTSASSSATRSEASQSTDILEDLHHKVSHSTLKLKSDLIKLIIASAEVNQSDDVVVMVDEAQNWEIKQWDFFKDVTNAVMRRSKSNIRVVTVSFGQIELKEVRSSVLKHTDLIDRFFPTIHEFKGVSNLNDLETIFEQYDKTKTTEWPQDSGISYSEFLMPLAFAGGWRLKNEMGLLWQAFEDTDVAYRYVKASAVFQSVKQFFDQNSGFDSADFRGSSKLWNAAVAASNFGTLHPKNP